MFKDRIKYYKQIQKLDGKFFSKLYIGFIISVSILICKSIIPIIYCGFIDSLSASNIIKTLSSLIIYYILVNTILVILNALFQLLMKILSRQIKSVVSLKYWDVYEKHYDDCDITNTRLAFSEDIQIVGEFVEKHIISYFTNFIGIIYYFIYMFRLQYKLAFFIIVSSILMYFVIKYFKRWNKMYSIKENEKNRDINQWLDEVLKNWRLVKLKQREEFILDFYKESMKDQAIIHKKKLRLGSRIDILNYLSANFFNEILIYIIGAVLISKNEMSIGYIIIFVNYSKKLSEYITGINGLNMELEADGIKIKRVIEVLDKNYEDYKEEIFKLQNQIKVSDVKFSYDNSNKELCIEDIVIEKGDFIGLIGQSGEGKSTFVSLLRGNLIPKKGNISYDDISISSLKKSKYFKNQVIVVSNRSFIFDDSIRANLLYAKPECTDEEMIYVCNMIGLNSNTLEKKTGKNGSLLSGGEKQKLILSRIILRDFQIVFLDEATSAMDDNSNKLVRNLLNTIWIDKTRIVITHNKDNITNATCIYTIDNGVISQMKRGKK